jgi:hypothetical protein
MTANPRAPKHRSRPGSGRTTPKGTRPPGTDQRLAPGVRGGVDHHLDTSRSGTAHGRPAAPPPRHLRTGTRGGR